MSVTTQLVHSVNDDWDETAANRAQTTLEQVVYSSHLLGSNRALANYGGGNTSAKGTATDHLGREVPAIWVKGSGSDLATMSDRDFTPLKLDEVLPLFARDEMSDEAMVAHLVRCQLDPAAPRSSIETLLHAFVPAAHVHHTHPDAINTIACAENGQALIAECFGDTAAWVEYIRPGFTLAKQVGEAVRANPDLKLVVLAKHGLVVWGDSARAAYEQTVAVCNQDDEFVNARTADQARFGGARGSGALSEDERSETLTHVLPTLRGAVCTNASAKILITDLSPAATELVDSLDGPTLTQIGAACPDHLVHTKRLPLWVAYDPASDSLDTLKDRIRAGVATYRDDYAQYFADNASVNDVMADANPRVVLIQNVGLVAVGPNVKRAKISRDLYHRAIEVMAGAHALSEFISLTAPESFAIEYWPLELYKLAQLPPARELEGKVAFVTGAAGGIGRAVMATLNRAGAAVVGFDIDADGAAAATADYGETGAYSAGDVTSEDAVARAFTTAVDAFGGVDIVISNAGIASSAAITETTLEEWNRNQSILGTGYFLVGREAFRVLEAQDAGGSIVFVASKNAIVAGPNAAAYSSAKALELHLARCLAAEGGGARIRVNTVNPDAVLRGSKIWQGEWRSERAHAYGLDADQLEEHYRKRTVLGVNIFPQDIAEAVLHFASEVRSGKSTGNILNVDGGVTAAFSR
jgi:rhamnulose-1-phosphate aldolase/alcohol dehydrogenase